VLALAADKGALCLTMSALDGLSDAEFAGTLPGLLAIFQKRLFMLWGITLLPIGFGPQAIALLKARSIARHRALSFLVGVLYIDAPDGVEIVNLAAALLMAVAFVPYGIELTRGGRTRGVPIAATPRCRRTRAVQSAVRRRRSCYADAVGSPRRCRAASGRPDVPRHRSDTHCASS
jgi:hypothetical protein